MYSILIVDDEKVICEGIKHRISMLNIPGLDSIQTALDGKEALKIIQKSPPDIIITDIRMPEVSGLELMETISGKYPHIKFIVLSGYETYDYIRSAFKLGAVDYLLKPVTTEDLEYHIRSIIAKLDEERKTGTAEPEPNPEDTDALLNHLVFGRPLHPRIQKEIPARLKALFPYDFFAVGIISIEYNLDYGKNLGLALARIETIKKETSLKGQQPVFYLLNHSKYPVIVFNFPKKEFCSNAVRLLQDFSNEFKKVSQVNSIPAISSVMSGTGNIRKLYAQAEEAVAYRILHEPCQVIEYLRLPSGSRKLNLNRQDFFSMESAVNLRSIKQFSRLIDKWFSRDFLANQTIENVKKLYEMIMKKISGLVSNQEYFIIDKGEKDFDHFFSLDEIKAYLKDYFYKILQSISQQEKREKTVVDIAIRYLNENYMKEVNMAEISNMISMNYSYFSKLFKTQTGMTFTEYLTMLRMEEAKRLLKDPVNRICEISAKVGYEDAHNFSRAFKNYFGISPKEFRKSNAIL